MTNWPGHSCKVCIGKFRLELDRAGGLIDLIVDHHAACRGRPRCGYRRRAPARPARPCAKARLTWASCCCGRVKMIAIGLIWVMTTIPGGVGRMDDVAGIDEAQPGAAGDRRDDPGVGQGWPWRFRWRPGRPAPAPRAGRPAPSGYRIAGGSPNWSRSASRSVRDRCAHCRAGLRPSPSWRSPDRAGRDRWWDRCRRGRNVPTGPPPGGTRTRNRRRCGTVRAARASGEETPARGSGYSRPRRPGRRGGRVGRAQ